MQPHRAGMRSGSARLWEKRFNPAEQFRARSIQRGGEAHNRAERRALPAPLQLANVGRVIAALERQFFLGEAPLLANLPEHFAEQVFCGFGGSAPTAMLLHAQFYTATIQTIVPETIVQIMERRPAVKPRTDLSGGGGGGGGWPQSHRK